MTEYGWTGNLPEMPEDATQAIIRALQDKKNMSREKVMEFADRLKKVWKVSFKNSASVDPDLTRSKFESILEQIDAIQAASLAVHSKVGNLTEPERDVWELAMWPTADFLSDTEAVRSKADGIAASLELLISDFSRGRGEYDRIDGKTAGFVARAAQSWRVVFKQEPSPRPHGLFSIAINDALIAAFGDDTKPLGHDALKTLIS